MIYAVCARHVKAGETRGLFRRQQRMIRRLDARLFDKTVRVRKERVTKSIFMYSSISTYMLSYTENVRIIHDGHEIRNRHRSVLVGSHCLLAAGYFDVFIIDG